MPGPQSPLANPAELAKNTGRSASDTQLLGALREASRAFRAAVHHPVTRTTEVLELDGKGGQKLRLLPPFPIVSIASIEVDGDPVPAGNYRVNKRNGILTSRTGVWPRNVPVEVTYTHGYEAIVPDGTDVDWPVDGPLLGLPEFIQGAVLEMAEIIMVAEKGVQSKTVLGDSITFGGSAVGATQKWTDAVDLLTAHTSEEA